MPFLLLFVGLSGVEVGVGGQFPWLTYTLQQIGFGVLSGFVIGLLAGWLMTRTEKRSWMVGEARQLAMLSLAILSWWVGGTLLPGNGFIAAFVAGGAIRYTYVEAQLEMKKFNTE
jgi:NhaP-type Na+/H+ or K+/H+ antiporter